ncbi:fluoride efflux transporter FluC [Bifidobacterium thermophilum]|uniref:fluoride efflux transporter FluC n=1 Tax=Bifidobacterium thermophilum TaxID=33905 RepID=UPI003F92F28E
MAKRSPLADPQLYVVVFIGGAIGTCVRYLLGLAIPATAAGFHFGTLAANLLACFVYAGLSAYLAQADWIRLRKRELVNRGAGMGVCGGLSTMSTLALEGFTGILGGQAWQALLYLLVSVVCGLLVAFAGVWCADRLADGHRVQRTATASPGAQSGKSRNLSNPNVSNVPDNPATSDTPTTPANSAEQEARQ